MKSLEIQSIQIYLKNLYKDLKFDEETHTYTLGKTFLLTGTTTYLKRFIEEFDEKKMSRASLYSYNKKFPKSKKRDVSYYLTRWECQNKAATYSGTRVHNYAEYNYPDFIDPPSCFQEEGVIQFFKNLSPKYKVVSLELRIYYESYRKAGTIDLILLNTDTQKLVLADWKTNKKNIFQYYNNLNLYIPFNQNVSSEYNKYSLQLSDYQNILELSGCKYDIEDKWIIHLYNNDWNFVDKYTDENKYNIKVETQPLFYDSYFRVYKAKDFTSELKNEYSKIII